VQFPDNGTAREDPPVKFPLLEQGLYIGDLNAVPFGNALMAAAEGTHALAEREVDIEADPVLVIALYKGAPHAFFPFPT
jgi:hypothetical protein